MKRILLTLALVAGLGFDAEAARARRRPRPKAKPLPVVTVPAILEVEEGAMYTGPPARVVVAVGQTTAIFTPSPVYQTVSTIVKGFANDGCAGPVCRQEGNQKLTTDVVYLTALAAGVSANLWIETADGPLMVTLTTVAQTAPFNSVVNIRTKASEAASVQIRAELIRCRDNVSVLRRAVDEAETAAREAAKLAGEAHGAGFREGVASSRAEALTAFQSFAVKVPRNSRKVKTPHLIVTEIGPGVRTPAGWWKHYRVENRLHNAVEIEATTKDGTAAELSGARTVGARSKKLFAVFVAAESDKPEPEIALRSISFERGVINGGK